MSASQGQWIVSTYAIFLAGFLMLTGRCADLYGRHRFFVAGLALFTTASFLGGLARDGTFLIAMRALAGVRCGARQPGGARDRALDVSGRSAALARDRAVGNDRQRRHCRGHALWRRARAVSRLALGALRERALRHRHPRVARRSSSPATAARRFDRNST